jgi:hypothetical protein
MDYRETQGGGGPTSTFAQGAAIAVRGPFTVELRDRLGSLSGILGDANVTLSDTRRRLLGDWPEVDAPDGAQPTKQPFCDEVIDYLDHLLRMARRNRDFAEVLANALG